MFFGFWLLILVFSRVLFILGVFDVFLLILVVFVVFSYFGVFEGVFCLFWCWLFILVFSSTPDILVGSGLTGLRFVGGRLGVFGILVFWVFFGHFGYFG